VQIIESGFRPAGNYQATFAANDLPSGVYYYQLSGDGQLQTRKMLLMK